MVKIFVTGDDHFGKKYDRYPAIKDILIDSRFEVLKDMVDKAEKESCGLFVVTGDLFDNINNIKVSDVKQVVEILDAFSGSVIVLPGNHDYYTGEEKIWKDFNAALSALSDHNITLITEFRPYSFDSGDDRIMVYPAYCDTKRSKENKLGWIRSAEIQKDGIINIGLAHGAIKGVTPDLREEYFLMTEEELMDIPVDAWLIGHTHIPYPSVLKEDEDTAGYKIFNAGTHEQTDFHNNTEGNGFIITIDKQGTAAKVLARKYVSGRIHFYDLNVVVKPDSDTALADAVGKAVEGIDRKSVVRIRVSGSIRQIEYNDRKKIYDAVLAGFLSHEIEDDELSEEITIDKIHTEYAETSFAARFLEKLIDDPIELQMAYQLLQNCREN